MRCSIKKVVVATTTLSLLAGVGASAALADRPDLTPTTFCHKEGTPAEKTMTLPRVAYERGHKTHGDTEGPCPGGGGGQNPPPGGENPPPGGEDPSVCEDVLEHLTDILPDEVSALLDLAAYASVDELLEALAILQVSAGIDLDSILDEITDGVCDLLDLVLHIKHKVLGVAFFATGEVFDLAGHVKHKTLGVVGFAAGAASHVVAEAIDEATAGVFVGLEVAVYGIFDTTVDASAAALVGLL